ncbi:MAG: toll/interleukin-1 receptor domain-containing protein [Terracidiphilus sp.]
MAEDRYDVFISYRRGKAAAEARLLRENLTKHGLNVFLDVTDLGRGYFDDSLLRRISDTPNFLLILSSHSLDRCANEGDWVHREVAHAILSERNIIPVMLPGFKFPKELPPSIASLPRYQAVEYSHTFFEATAGKILEMIQTGTAERPRTLKAKARLESVPARAISKKVRLALILALASVAATAGGLVLWRTLWSPDTRLLSLAARLRNDFHAALSAMPPAGAPDFTSTRNDIQGLLTIDPSSGYGVYYSGEVKRVQNRSLFTPKSCVIPGALNGQLNSMDYYESDFIRYLEIERTLPAAEKGGDYSLTPCYSRPGGYCVQRTAWIEQLLADDSYQEALVTSDQQIAQQYLETAIAYAQKVLASYRDINNRPGFQECIDTQVLLQEAQQKLEDLKKTGAQAKQTAGPGAR